MASEGTGPTVVTKVEIGQCIYCRAFPSLDDELQNEHIIPLGLYGKDILVKASCKCCAAKTSAFEARVQKQDLGGLRIALNFPTTHKPRRKGVTTLPIEIVTNNGQTKDINVPLEDYYASLPFPVFDPPAHLSGAPYTEGIEMTQCIAVPPRRSLEEVAQKYDAQEMATWTLRYPEAWALMFAKIGYALAVGHYGLSRIRAEDTYVLNAILGKSNDVGRWVGCDGRNVFDRQNAGVSQVAGVYQVGDEIHARIKLFAWLAVPEYLVIVGRLSA